jgi:beta-phosphoglucomutase family hydrolase
VFVIRPQHVGLRVVGVVTSVEGLDWSTVDAVLFDLDGVITPTAEVHMHAWAEMFAPYLEERHVAPYSEQDYFAHIDGRPRYDGVAALLASRDLDVPWGDPSDTPDADTVCGLGNRKNALFGEVLARDGVQVYPGSLELLDALDARGTRMAIVSSSANAPDVLRAAGLLERFETVVDGAVAREHQLPGKPRPDTYEFAADALGVPHPRAAVVEDAVSGVQAGAAGDFAVVVGVDRGAGADTLLSHGADVVVEDLAELVDGVQAPTGARR